MTARSALLAMARSWQRAEQGHLTVELCCFEDFRARGHVCADPSHCMTCAAGDGNSANGEEPADDGWLTQSGRRAVRACSSSRGHEDHLLGCHSQEQLLLGTMKALLLPVAQSSWQVAG